VADGTGYFAVVGGRLLAPVAIEPDRPSDWKSNAHQADYIMITHPRLAAAVQPLADFHRRRGLHVEVVDIGDIYDEFNAGVLHPRAIRDFVSHAYHDWQPPRPRFVLLVGDASWDTKNARLSEADYPDAAFNPGHGVQFAHIASTPYSEASELNHRNLIPTWNYGTYDGHAAGDNGFVAVDGGDLQPDLAIGRFPVTEPADVTAIVDKTIRYMSQPEPGPWRRDILWITNEESGMQSWSDTLARELGARGFSSEKVYPPVAEQSDGREQERLRESMARGHLIVHFAGHGGRFVWRTGPPDWSKHRDLFNLEDIDKLPASDRLPIVLSMTCYSAPFDHPSADSIGEKFLRVPGKGAVAVFAASWRNAPSLGMSRPLFDDLLTAGTIGEAIEHAKRNSQDRTFIQQYNLLGDPALKLALPTRLDVAVAAGNVEVPWPTPGASGRASVEWLTETYAVAAQADVAVEGKRLRLPIPARADLRFVRVYVSGAAGVDWMGIAALPAVPAPATPTQAPHGN